MTNGCFCFRRFAVISVNYQKLSPKTERLIGKWIEKHKNLPGTVSSLPFYTKFLNIFKVAVKIFRNYNQEIYLYIEILGFAIFCCAHMPRKIPKQKEGGLALFSNLIKLVFI